MAHINIHSISFIINHTICAKKYHIGRGFSYIKYASHILTFNFLEAFLTLLEIESLPSVRGFAECQTSDTQQSHFLLSVALDKGILCWVLHSAKKNIRQSVLCRVPHTRQRLTLGKAFLYRVSDARQSLALGKGCRRWRCPSLPSVHRHSAKIFYFLNIYSLPSAVTPALGKDFYFF